MEKQAALRQGNKIGKRILFVVIIIGILFVLLCTIKIVQIQRYSIWSENDVKPLYQYDHVLIMQNGWGEPCTPLDRKDLIQLYFVLGSTRKYDPEKDQKYIPDGKILGDTSILFYDSEQNRGAAYSIRWEYGNNTLAIERESHGKRSIDRYYINKKNSEILHELYEKNLDG